MSETNLCQRCGDVLPQDGLLGGRCPRCMLEMGFESAAGNAEDSEPTTASAAHKDSGSHAHPAVIGRYRILRLIGEGGMGAVYEAEQSQPRRIVALKIIKPGMASPELVRRFGQESQALGRLQHPGIAQIYEAGTVDTGFGPQPYFAMELIDGSTPRDHAEAHHLNTRERLEIMVKICEAVHHAHQRGLIHRDLKPANILIDKTGQPKVLDFGVARVTDSDSRATVQTDLGQLVGTLAYMSPEQVLADPLDIDTRSDVYSLGVILYEFLSGRLPYTISKKLHETIQTIREEDPLKLSAVNRTYRGDIETIVAKALDKDRTRRYASAAGMAADIQRFLKDEPIVARPPSASYQLQKFARRNKALVTGVAAVFVVLVGGIVAFRSQAVRARYAETAALAEQKETAAERDRANANADRADEASVQAREQLDIAVQLKNRADTETSKATALRKFVEDLLGNANPYPHSGSGQPNQAQTSSGPNITKEALDLSVKQIPVRFDRQPLQEAAIREFVADTYVGIGSYGEGRDQLELVVALRRREQGETDPETLRATAKLADVCSDLNLYPKAEELAKKVILDAHRSSGDADSSVRAAVSTLVWIYSGTLTNTNPSRGFSQIDRFFKEDVIDYQRRKFGEGNSTLQFGISQLLSLYTDFKPPKYEEAEVFMKGIADARRRMLGEGNPATLNAEKQLIGLYLIPQPQPKYADAEAYLKPLVDAQRRTLGDDSPAMQATINDLLSVYLDQPQPPYAEAEDFLKRMKEDARRKLGSESGASRNATIGLANLYFKQGRYPEAADLLLPLASNAAVAEAMTHPLTLEIEPAILDNLDRSSQVYGKRVNSIPADMMARLTRAEHPAIADVLDLLSQIYSKQGNSVQAHAMANKLRSILEAALNSAHKPGLGGESLVPPLRNVGALAIRYIDQGSYIEAEEMLNTVVDGYRRVAGIDAEARNVATLPNFDAMPYINPGNDSQVGGYQQLAGSNANARDIATLLTSAAIAFTDKGNDRLAERLLTEVLDINHAALGDNNWDTQRSFWRLAAWYMDRGRLEEARGTFDRLHKIQAGFYGAGHTITRTTMLDMSVLSSNRMPVESARGRQDRVRLLVESRLDIERQLVALYRSEPGGEKSSLTRIQMSGVGIDLGILGRYAEAEKAFSQLLEIQKISEGSSPGLKLATIANIGWAQFHQEKYAESEANLREALRGLDEIPIDNWARHNTESMLGAALVGMKKYAEAEPHLLNSYEKMPKFKPGLPASGFTGEAEPGERILTLYREWGKPEKVAEWRQKLQTNKPAASTSSAQGH